MDAQSAEAIEDKRASVTDGDEGLGDLNSQHQQLQATEEDPQGSEGGAEEADEPEQQEQQHHHQQLQKSEPEINFGLDTVVEQNPPAGTAAARSAPAAAVVVANGGSNGRMDNGHGSVTSAQGGADACKMCHKRVYPMEMLTSDGQIYHKSCYRCSKCQRQLSVGNFSILENQLYCQPHYLELFMLKGSYKFSEAGGVPVNSIAATGSSEELDGSGEPSESGGDGQQQQSLQGPRLNNIKSKFESFDESTPAAQSKRKEKVYYAGLQSAKHRYETATSEKEKPHSEKPKRFTPPRDGSAGVVESQPQELPPDVVRYYDNGDSDDRPAPGSSRNVLARFKEMEQQNQNGGQAPPAKETGASRPRSPPPVSKASSAQHFDYTAPVTDSTLAESNPAPPPEGVVRSGAPDPADELPPPNAAQAALRLWRDKEGPAGGPLAPPNPAAAAERQLVAARERQMANRNVRLPQQQQQQLLRDGEEPAGSGDRADDDGEGEQLPPEGTARNLRSLFNSFGQQQQQQQSA